MNTAYIYICFFVEWLYRSVHGRTREPRRCGVLPSSQRCQPRHYYRGLCSLNIHCFLDQELISYRYSSCSCPSSCRGDLFKKPRSPSFQIGLGWNLLGLFFEQIRIEWWGSISSVTSYFEDGGYDVRPSLVAAYGAASAGCPLACQARVTSLFGWMRYSSWPILHLHLFSKYFNLFDVTEWQACMLWMCISRYLRPYRFRICQSVCSKR